MLSFKDYILTESKNNASDDSTHIHHLSRLINNFSPAKVDPNTQQEMPKSNAEESLGGHSGVASTDEILNTMHNALLGKKLPSHFTMDEMIKGNPSFVAKKNKGVLSVGHVNPDGSHTMVSNHDDIDKLYYDHSPYVADKMHKLLDNIGKVLPNSPHTFHGEYLGDDISSHRDKLAHTVHPNSHTSYSFPANSKDGLKAGNAKIMVAFHTMHPGSKANDQSARPIDKKTREKFEDHPDVHNVDPSVKFNPNNYTPDEQRDFLSHMTAAKKEYSKMKPEAEDAISRHSKHLEDYLNDSLRIGAVPSMDGYKDHLTDITNRKLDHFSTDSGRKKELIRHADLIKDAEDNHHHLNSALEMHRHFDNAKEVLMNVIHKNSNIQHSRNGIATGTEGILVSKKHPDGSVSVTKAMNNSLERKM